MPSKISAGMDDVSLSLETTWYSNDDARVHSKQQIYSLSVPTQSRVAGRYSP